MVVDDDELFRRHVTQFVEQFCRLRVVDEAASAEEALERVGRVRPAVILLDVSMGGMSGLDAIDELKSASPGSVIIVVSSMPQEYAERAVALGADGYVVKSRIVDELPAAVQARLEGR